MKTITDESFVKYGKVLDGYDFTALLGALETTPMPESGVAYVGSVPELEATPSFEELSLGAYGGMPIQIGYCNGHNVKLGCLEYHRGSEINVALYDMALMLAPLQAVKDNKLDTSLVEIFKVPAGKAVLLYETTLHYAPCHVEARGFKAVVVLPRGTNAEKPEMRCKNDEDKLLFACNKWLLAHPEAPEASQGAVAGLVGKNTEL